MALPCRVSPTMIRKRASGGAPIPTPPPTLKHKRTLSKDGSGKEIVHYEIALGDSGIEYRAGDVINIFPHSSPAYVDSLLAILQCSGDEHIPAW